MRWLAALAAAFVTTIGSLDAKPAQTRADRTAPSELLSARTYDTQVPGLTAPGEILVDVWGIPHIYAANERDLFFLQGYNAARDRLWQIDLWRKRGLGRLAQDFGPTYVEQDRALRLFTYRGDMDAEWASYGPKAKSYAEAFVAGINRRGVLAPGTQPMFPLMSA
jgi:penicillin amidase